MSEPKVGEVWKERNKHYRIDLVTDHFVVLSAVNGDLDDGMVVNRDQWDECGLKKVEKKE